MPSILSGALFSTLVTVGLPYSFGTFYTDFLETFDATRREATLVQALFVGVSTGAGIPVGFFIHRFGVRRTMMVGSVLGFLGLFLSWFGSTLVYLVVSVGLVTGFGGCMVNMTVTVMVAEAFDRNRGLALALVLAMSGLGPVVFPKLLEVMKLSYGLKGALLILSGFYLNILIPAITMTSSKSCTSEQSVLRKLRSLYHPVYITYCITSAVCISGLNVIMVIIVDLAISRQLSADMGINYILIINCLVTVFASLVGFVKRIPNVHGAVVFCLCTVLCGTAVLFMSKAVGYWPVTICVIFYGTVYGGAIGMQSVAVLDTVGQNALAFGMGVRGGLIGVGNPLLAVLSGWLYDETGSYTLSLQIIGVSVLAASSLTLVSILVYNCVSGRKRRTTVYHIN